MIDPLKAIRKELERIVQQGVKTKILPEDLEFCKYRPVNYSYIAAMMHTVHSLHKFKKHTIVVGHSIHYQCNYCYVSGESQVIILN